MQGKIPVSVGILTRNSGATLRRALESVKECSDIIVCDGGSTDDTLTIAAEYGARIFSQKKDFLDKDGRLFDYGGARNQTLDAANQAWFLMHNSDEYAGQDLIDAIRKTVELRHEGVFWVNRKYVCRGTVVDCATTYPNRQMRLFARQSVKQFVKLIHERMELQTGVVPESIDGTMYVPFDESPRQLRAHWDYQLEVDLKRLDPLSLPDFITSVYENTKVSFLYALRLIRIFLFCRGNRMPLAFEFERQRYLYRALRSYWRITKF
jgi:glycosyltransferase involved in cell wall biosynthesis